MPRGAQNHPALVEGKHKLPMLGPLKALTDSKKRRTQCDEAVCPVGVTRRRPLRVRVQGAMEEWVTELFLPLSLTTHCDGFGPGGYLRAGAGAKPKMEQASR